MLPLKISLPTRAPAPPAGPDWLREIKHDGFRMIARRDGERVRLISRRGLDWGDRFQAIAAAVKALAVRTCTIDGEVIACDVGGFASFEAYALRRIVRW
jgi:ATP-dependent DNA ligase